MVLGMHKEAQIIHCIQIKREFGSIGFQEVWDKKGEGGENSPLL